MFADFCSFNKLVIGGNVFPYTKAHNKVTCVSPDSSNQNQIDQICVSSKFKRSLLDVRYQVLASLEGNEQRLGKGENQTVVNQVWQGMKMHGGRRVRKR